MPRSIDPCPANRSPDQLGQPGQNPDPSEVELWLEERPEVQSALLYVAAIRVLAFSKIRLGQKQEGVRILQTAVDRTGDLFLVRSLAQAQIIAGDNEGALKTLEIFQTLDPHDGRVFVLRGDILVKQGLKEQAIGEYRKPLELDEQRSGIRARQRISRLEGD